MLSRRRDKTLHFGVFFASRCIPIAEMLKKRTRPITKVLRGSEDALKWPAISWVNVSAVLLEPVQHHSTHARRVKHGFQTLLLLLLLLPPPLALLWQPRRLWHSLISPDAKHGWFGTRFQRQTARAQARQTDSDSSASLNTAPGSHVLANAGKRDCCTLLQE